MFLEHIGQFIADNRGNIPTDLATLNDLLNKNGSLNWQEMVLGMLALIDANESQMNRLSFLENLSPEKATGEMLAAAAGVLRYLAPSVPISSKVTFDCCGTGGDKLGLFNFSTMSGLVLAAAGVPVVKHGNRAITSSCGSADLLQGLGINLEQPPEKAAESLDKASIAFFLAPFYHSATRQVQPLRIELSKRGIPTLFNLLGPLSNPVCPTHQLAGVFNPLFQQKMAEAFSLLGCEEVWVLCGESGIADSWMDEVSACGTTHVVFIRDKQIDRFEIHPSEAGIKPIPVESLKGGDLSRNLQIAESVLVGEDNPVTQAVCLNAAVALKLLQRVTTLAEGYQYSLELLKSGKVRANLDLWREICPIVK